MIGTRKFILTCTLMHIIQFFPNPILVGTKSKEFETLQLPIKYVYTTKYPDRHCSYMYQQPHQLIKKHSSLPLLEHFGNKRTPYLNHSLIQQLVLQPTTKRRIHQAYYSKVFQILSTPEPYTQTPAPFSMSILSSFLDILNASSAQEGLPCLLLTKSQDNWVTPSLISLSLQTHHPLILTLISEFLLLCALAISKFLLNLLPNALSFQCQEIPLLASEEASPLEESNPFISIRGSYSLWGHFFFCRPYFQRPFFDR